MSGLDVTPTEARALQAQLTALWTEVERIKATLDERDLEQCKLEGVVEHLLYHRRGGVAWSRPKRRWTQFGSSAELRALAARFGITTARHTREWLVRELWEARALPGSVALRISPNFAEIEEPPPGDEEVGS
jgi:hypothetical protein